MRIVDEACGPCLPGMRIIEDKLNEYPPHRISRADIKRIFAVVPEEWIFDVEVVRLAGGNPHPNVAVFNAFAKTLTIKSRGRSTEETVRCILRELAGKSLGTEFVKGHKFQTRDIPNVNRVVEPLLSEILPLISGRKRLKRVI